MAIELEDEHEVGEQVKAWLRENGGTLITGIALGVAGIFGWNWWQSSRFEQRITAATQFGALTAAAEAGDLEAASALAESLADSGSGGYRLFAQLRLADLQLSRGELDAARQTLAAAAGKLSKDPVTGALVAVRLARLDLADGAPQQALDRLSGVDPAFAGIAAGLRGDALVQLGRLDEAREAYREALTHAAAVGPQREIIERKLAQLGPAAAPEAEA